MLLINKDLVDILKIEEEITIKNNEQFKLEMSKFLSDCRQFLVLDLDEVSYLNSSALGIIADTAMKAKKEHKELVLSGIKPPIDEIFKIVKFDTFMRLFPTLKEAEEYFSNL
ncbi:STAS domain-containing protein [Bacillus pinisoli]|uniref:STAS domain-containing protein n=1 Tax=Bacillus pinisoli TaxID=2901866 RepID=UPI001FF38281|nr:STAS domain-containing protein [Bacillus pinisoli]